MAKSKKPETTINELESIETVLTSSEAFIEKNQKKLLVGLGAIVLIVLSYLLYSNYYAAPREQKAAEMIAVGQTYFAQGNYETALNGDSVEFDGMLYIASKYAMTKSGNLASVYAGLCYYKLGDYDNAIKFLDKANLKDEVIAFTAMGTIGDAYVQKGDLQRGIEYFLKAAKTNNPMVAPTYLLKAGKAYEQLERYDKAVEMYERIKADYTNKLNGFSPIDDIDKYIQRANTFKK